MMLSLPSLVRYLLHLPAARLRLIGSLIVLSDALLDDFTLHMRLTMDLLEGKGARSSCLSSL